MAFPFLLPVLITGTVGRTYAHGITAVAFAAGAAWFGRYNAHDFGILLEVFVFAARVIVAHLLALVEEFDAAGVMHIEFSGRRTAEFADFEIAFGYGEGCEVERVGCAFVPED